MMDEVIQMVSSKAGIGADQARTAVDTVVNFLKDKLPAPVAAQLDSLLGGGGAAGGVGGMLGGLLGGDKQE